MEQVYNNMLEMIQRMTERQASAPRTGRDVPDSQGEFHRLLENRCQAADEDGSGAGNAGSTAGGGETAGKQDETDVDAAAVIQGQLMWAAIALVQQPAEPQGPSPQPEAPAAAPELVPVSPLPEAQGMGFAQPELPPEAPVTEKTGNMQAELTAEPQSEPTEKIGGERIQAAPAAGEAAAREKESGEGLTSGLEKRQDDSGKTVLTAENAPRPVFEKADAALIRVGDPLAPQGEKSTENVERQLAGGLEKALRQGETQVKIQLEPASLGSIQVELTWGRDGALHVLLTAETSETRSLLDRSAAGLQGLLSHTGAQNVQVEVQRQQESQQQQFYDGRDGADQGGHQQDRQQRRQPNQQTQDFLQQLRLGLIPMEGKAV